MKDTMRRWLPVAAGCLALGTALAVDGTVTRAQAPQSTTQTPPAQGRGRGAAGGGTPTGGDQAGRGGRGGRGGAAPAAPARQTPDISGIWNGGGGARPVNSENFPWTKDNFPVLNERGLAYQKVFDEAIAPKYDCVPASSPAIQYDPYYMQVVQWPDRVLIRYEKDDQLRTVWLDGRKPTVNDWSLQGFSVGHYDGNALIVETDHFLFDVTGFDDYNGIPSSQLKKVTERYWKEGDELKMTLTLEDPLMLRKPASYTTRWLPARPGYEMNPWECDAEAARAPIKMMVPKYK